MKLQDHQVKKYKASLSNDSTNKDNDEYSNNNNE